MVSMEDAVNVSSDLYERPRSLPLYAQGILMIFLHRKSLDKCAKAAELALK